MLGQNNEYFVKKVRNFEFARIFEHFEVLKKFKILCKYIAQANESNILNFHAIPPV
jgi:hypothetical protein